METDKQLANWIYWEEGGEYYCSECIEIRLRDINKNKEFSRYVDYDNGEDCGYYQDYALEDYEVECCICGKPLFSQVDC